MKNSLENNKFHFKKKFGQNFICDENLIDKIIDKSEIDKDTLVVEVGPGYGTLTNKNYDEIEKEFEGRGYGDFKIAVANAVIEKLKPIQDKYNKLLENPKYLEEIYIEGAKKARLLASKTLEEVKTKIGIL